MVWAARWCGVCGEQSGGSTASDFVGAVNGLGTGVIALSNGNYLVVNPY